MEKRTPVPFSLHPNHTLVESGITTRFFLWIKTMTHPLIPQIIEIATPIAEELTLEVVEAVFQTNKRPPTLRVDIRNPAQDTSLNDCEQMSRALEAALDHLDIIPGAYVLEVSSPGTTRKLNSDRGFHWKKLTFFSPKTLASSGSPQICLGGSSLK